MRFRLMILHYLRHTPGNPAEWVYRIGGFAETLKEAKELYQKHHAGTPAYVERRFGTDRWIQVAHSTHA